MEIRDESVLITLYNVFCTLFIPFAVAMAGMWELEAKSDFTRGRAGCLPVGVICIFVPVIFFGLKWEFNCVFTMLCSALWFLLLMKLAHRYFLVVTDAPVTHCVSVVMLCAGLLWSIIIELHAGLKQHILEYPQREWLTPCSHNPGTHRVFQTICLTSLILSGIFTIATKWM